MSTPALHTLAIPPGELEKSSNWRLKGSINWTKPTRGEAEKTFSGYLNDRLLRLNAVSRSTSKIKVKATWYRAGVAHFRVRGSEAHSEQVPLGESYLVFPLAGQRYKLAVWPRQWLPNLKIKVWAYVGPIGVGGAQSEQQQQQEWDWRSALPD